MANVLPTCLARRSSPSNHATTTTPSTGRMTAVIKKVNETVIKSARNIPGVVTTTAKILSVYDIVNAGKFIVDKAALAVIEEVFA